MSQGVKMTKCPDPKCGSALHELFPAKFPKAWEYYCPGCHTSYDPRDGISFKEKRKGLVPTK